METITIPTRALNRSSISSPIPYAQTSLIRPSAGGSYRAPSRTGVRASQSHQEARNGDRAGVGTGPRSVPLKDGLNGARILNVWRAGGEP
jgi:hypothetical protein